jgi:D-sedoheptulose 7-phosphate isomerase
MFAAPTGMKQYIQTELSKTLRILQLVASDAEIATTLQDVATACCSALRRGNKLLFAGNGGSAADAQHLAGELVSRFNFDRPGLPAIALTTDTSVLTAIGNDSGYELVFARQVNALGTRGDIFVAISTSGRSPNILRALEEAREKGLITVGLSGQTGGDMPVLCDHLVRIPSNETPKIQEGHIMLGHILCGLIECTMFPGN